MDDEQRNDDYEAQVDENIEPVSWSASEYIAHEKSNSWHGFLFAGTGILTFVVFLVSRDILASLVILLSGAAMSVYARKKPSQKSYELNDAGIAIDGRPYPFSLFKSFSLVEEGQIDSIWLKPLNRLSPTIVVYFPPEEIDKIEDILSAFLPFEEKSLDAIDRLTKRMRF